MMQPQTQNILSILIPQNNSDNKCSAREQTHVIFEISRVAG